MIAFDFLWALIAAPIVALLVTGLGFVARRVRVRRARQWAPALGQRAARMGRWGAFPLGLAALAAVVAFAGPRWGTRVVETETKGLNMVLALDISRSMLAEDAAPSRLERAKRESRRLIHDLEGDRIGLLAFAGQSFIMSPLTVDGGALTLLVDALDPDVASAGGTELAQALRQGRDLLLAGDQVADRVLVLFSDGEAHDTLPDVIAAAERLRRSGVRLILVAQGGRDPAPIPVRDLDGQLLGYQRDPSEQTVQTRRRDDVLSAVADAAQGVLVSAEVPDQAGRIRDLIAAFKRSPEATTTADQDISRAWIPLLTAAVLLLLQAVSRRTTALVTVALALGAGTLAAQAPRNEGDEAWNRGDVRRAAEMYLAQVRDGQGGDTAWFNLGTAALAVGDTALARQALGRAAASLEPNIRFRARYNLGLLELRLAERDTAASAQHLEEALRHYREALLLRPGHREAKWNLELALRRMPPSDPSGGQGPQGSGGDEASPPPAPQGLSVAQAEQILNSIAEEERRTRERMNRRRSQSQQVRGRKDW